MSADSTQPRPRRWPRRLALGCAIGIAIVLGVHAYISHRIAGQLRSIVRSEFGADLRAKRISWRPWYGVAIHEPIVVRRDAGAAHELFRAEAVDIRLAGMPDEGAPVVIESVHMRRPVLRLAFGPKPPAPQPPAPAPAAPVAATPATPAPPPKPPPQIRWMHIEDGALVVPDVTGGAPELLAGITLDLRAPPDGGPLHGVSITIDQAGTKLAAQAAADLGARVLHVSSLSLQVRLEPTASAFPMPALFEPIVRKHRLAGAISLSGSGTVPLREPAASTFRGTIDLRDGAIAPLGSDLAFDRVAMTLTCESTLPPEPEADEARAQATQLSGATDEPSPQDRAQTTQPSGATREAGPASAPTTTLAATPMRSPPVQVRIAGLQARLGEATLVLHRGLLVHDPTRAGWRIANIEGTFRGREQQETPTGNPAGAKLAVDVRDDYHLRGRVDFTIAANGPWRLGGRPWQDAIRYELLAFPRKLAFKPKGWPLPIEEIDGGAIVAGNGEVGIRAVAGRYGGDYLSLLSARIPVPRDVSELWRISTPLEQIDATLTCRQPAPAYPPGLQDEWDALRPEGTFALRGRYEARHGPPADDYALEVESRGEASFAISRYRVPLAQLEGKAIIEPHLVQVLPTRARTLDGTLTTEVRIVSAGAGKPGEFSGKLWVRELDLRLMCLACGLTSGGADRLAGKATMDAEFQSISPTGGPEPASVLDTLRASGEVQVTQGHFWGDPIGQGIESGVKGDPGAKAASKPNGSPPATRNAGDAEAAAVFELADRELRLRHAAISSPEIGVQGWGTVILGRTERTLDLVALASPLGDLKQKLRRTNVPLVGDVLAELAGVVQGILREATGSLLYQYRITGNINQPKHELVPTPLVSDPLAKLFAAMVQENPDKKLMEAVREKARQE